MTRRRAGLEVKQCAWTLRDSGLRRAPGAVGLIPEILSVALCRLGILVDWSDLADPFSAYLARHRALNRHVERAFDPSRKDLVTVDCLTDR
jgi:hypothetical protein